MSLKKDLEKFRSQSYPDSQELAAAFKDNDPEQVINCFKNIFLYENLFRRIEILKLERSHFCSKAKLD